MNTVATTVSAASAASTPTGSGASQARCFHCGLDVPAHTNWSVTIDQVPRAMCCPGCMAVATSIVECGFADYYRTRIGYSITAEQETILPPQLDLYDTQDTQDVHGAPKPAGAGQGAATASGVYSIEGMHCAACVWLIERRLARVPGVRGVELNVANARLSVSRDPALCKSSDVLKAVREIGYIAYPFDPTRHVEGLEIARKTLFRRLFVAGLSMMQVMMYALPVYLATDGTMDASMEGLMRWASLLLTLPAVLYSAQPFFAGAWSNIRNRMPGMDVPVALGVAAAFGASVIATVRGSGEVYFDSTTMFIFLLLCSRYLELGARRKAAATLEDLQHALPASAWKLAGYPAARDSELVAAQQVRRGDIILVKPGEAIAADGIILEGATSIDLSLLTGESRPQPMQPGDRVPGGAVNSSQPMIVQVTQESGASTLSVLMKLIERAGQGKPEITFWADRVAAWFVAALLLSSLVAFAAWQWIDPSRAWPVAIAMLVVSCPCALSLAMPTVLAAATDRLQRQGALIVQSHVLETLYRATHVVFDKTGTLTVGQLQLQHVEAIDAGASANCLLIAAQLEIGSQHPLGKALIEAAGRAGHLLSGLHEAETVSHVAGSGVQGWVDGTCYRLGNAGYVAQLSGTAPHDTAPENVSSIYLGSEGRWLARFDFSDTVRHDAQAVVEHFSRMGKSVILLSGDRQALVTQVARRLHIATARGDMLPEQKLAYVQELQRHGAIVAMVGDGINDAAVLGGADVSFAMGNGTALAQTHADCVLLSGGLSSLLNVAQTAAKAQSVIRQNLAWATLYNLVAIPTAALGLLNPWLSAIGMSASSAFVVLNALRLRRLPAGPNRLQAVGMDLQSDFSATNHGTAPVQDNVSESLSA
jgi:Cu2+-exporting ATPase